MRRKYPGQPVVGAGTVILANGKLVLVKRGAESALGKWSIPGGAVELGEAVRDAAIREAKEECGLEVELVDDKPMDVVDNLIVDKDGRLRYHYILLQSMARPKGGTLRPTSDVTEARWVLLDEVELYELTASFRHFFRKHRSELEKH